MSGLQEEFNKIIILSIIGLIAIPFFIWEIIRLIIWLFKHVRIV